MSSTAECLVLGLLNDGLRYGHEIDRVMDTHNVRHWAPVNRATIYQVLARLTDKGWVEAGTEREGRMPERTVYTITPEGRAALADMVAEGLSSRDFVPLPYNVPVIFLGAVPREEALARLNQRREFLARLRDAVAVKAAIPGTPLGARASVRHMLEFYNMEVRWMEWLIAELQDPNAVVPAQGAFPSALGSGRAEDR